ncbi:MAG: (Na+)-NQR maturation NqrM [Gammaproteobacteria bacterium]|nr:(Na+)-NQR maturation NqrM [Gammaproteobacteria bacterium]
MSLGVIVSGRRIQGSCGGLSSIPGIESDCGGRCRHQRGEQGATCRPGTKVSAANDRRRCARHGTAAAPERPDARSV